LSPAARAILRAIVDRRPASIADRFVGLSQHTLYRPTAVLAEIGLARILRAAIRAGFEELRKALLADTRRGEIIGSALRASHDKLTATGLKPVYKILD
jgi:hypothetical protein